MALDPADETGERGRFEVDPTPLGIGSDADEAGVCRRATAYPDLVTSSPQAMTGRIEPLPLPSGPTVLAALPRLAEALRGHPIAPYAATSPPPLLPRVSPESLPDDLAVVVGTSGSTGDPKLAMLTAGALAASIGATHRRLGGPGQWLLTLPAHHIAGLQVLLRGLVAGQEPIVTTTASVTDVVRGAAAMDPDARRYVSLVPTQVARLLEDDGGRDALRSFDAVLVGGAALPPRLRSTADREGVILVATYGMSETCGGCVYDGRPLEGTRVALDDDGRVHLGGPSLASGYLADPERTDSHFVADTAGERWFRTDDHGEFLPDGRLQVHGRLDDLITTGGLKVSPRLVEETIVAHCPGVIEALVVGVPDPEWGQAVGAIVTTASGTRLTREDVREALRGILPGHALPQRVRTVPAIPTRGPGKPDRRGAADLLSDG